MLTTENTEQIAQSYAENLFVRLKVTPKQTFTILKLII